MAPVPRRIPRSVLAPSATVPHQVRTISVQMHTTPDGGLVVQSSGAPGWSAMCRNKEQLAHAINRALLENQVAAHARWRGKPYDMQMETREPRARRTSGRQRRDTHALEEWTLLDDGRWCSPRGMKYRPDSAMAQRIVQRRRERGLPT